MASETQRPLALRDGLVDGIRCRRCRGALVVEGRTDLVCLSCGDRQFGERLVFRGQRRESA